MFKVSNIFRKRKQSPYKKKEYKEDEPFDFGSDNDEPYQNQYLTVDEREDHKGFRRSPRLEELKNTSPKHKSNSPKPKVSSQSPKTKPKPKEKKNKSKSPPKKVKEEQKKEKEESKKPKKPKKRGRPRKDDPRYKAVEKDNTKVGWLPNWKPQ